MYEECSRRVIVTFWVELEDINLINRWLSYAIHYIYELQFENTASTCSSAYQNYGNIIPREQITSIEVLK